MMTKAELIDCIAKEGGISKEKAGSALNSLIDGIQSALKSKNGKVQLTGFGTFSTVHRNARKGRNPGTGEEINIPAQNIVKFKPGKNLKDAVAD
jgi:DNA-binding protein HU-beta